MGFSSGHSELFVAISQLKELRTTTKAQIAAQESAIDDLNKWSSKENNRGLIESLNTYQLILCFILYHCNSIHSYPGCH